MGNDKRENLLIKKTAPFLVLLAGILWGTMGLFVRTLNGKGLNTMEIVALRSIVTCAVLFLFLLVYNRQMLKIRLKDVWCFVGAGLFSIVFFNYCYFKAITMTSLSVAAVLLYTAPVMVMIMSYFLFHEKFTRRKVVAVVLTFLGCVLVTGIAGNGAALSPKGILVGLGAGFGYALYSIFGKFAIERGYHSFTISFYTFLMAAIGSVPLADREGLITAVVQEKFMFAFMIIFLLFIPFCVMFGGFYENTDAHLLCPLCQPAH